jgi:hypothetical protein
MTEDEIAELVSSDDGMMDVLGVAATLALPNWLIGAGFLRNKVWDHLHGRRGPSSARDIDLAYFDPSEQHDEKSLEARLAELRPSLKWDVKNQATVHHWNGERPCGSVIEALSRWPETATAVGVTLQHGRPALIAPWGIADLTNLVVRPTPAFMESEAKRDRVRTRFREKRWQEMWPRLRLDLV